MSIVEQRVFKGQSTNNKSVQHHSQGKNISSFAVIKIIFVMPSFMYLWSHESSLGSFVRPHQGSLINSACKSKIRHFNF